MSASSPVSCAQNGEFHSRRGRLENERLIVAAELPQKLDALFRAYRARPSLTPNINNANALADNLKVSEGTVSGWRRGRSERGQDIGKIQPKHVAELVRLTKAFSGDALTQDELTQLWINEPAIVLEARAFGPPSSAFERLLDLKKPTLKVTIDLDSPGFHMVAEYSGPSPGDFIVEPSEPFRLVVEGEKGRSLMVFEIDEEGWSWITPGMLHAGPITIFPQSIPMRIPGPIGYHRFVVVELPLASPPFIRAKGDPMRMTTDREVSFAKLLMTEAIAKEWRWGEVKFVLDKRPQRVLATR